MQSHSAVRLMSYHLIFYVKKISNTTTFLYFSFIVEFSGVCELWDVKSLYKTTSLLSYR